MLLWRAICRPSASNSIVRTLRKKQTSPTKMTAGNQGTSSLRILFTSLWIKSKWTLEASFFFSFLIPFQTDRCTIELRAKRARGVSWKGQILAYLKKRQVHLFHASELLLRDKLFLCCLSHSHFLCLPFCTVVELESPPTQISKASHVYVMCIDQSSLSLLLSPSLLQDPCTIPLPFNRVTVRKLIRFLVLCVTLPASWSWTYFLEEISYTVRLENNISDAECGGREREGEEWVHQIDGLPVYINRARMFQHVSFYLLPAASRAFGEAS